MWSRSSLCDVIKCGSREEIKSRLPLMCSKWILTLDAPHFWLMLWGYWGYRVQTSLGNYNFLIASRGRWLFEKTTPRLLYKFSKQKPDKIIILVYLYFIVLHVSLPSLWKSLWRFWVLEVVQYCISTPRLTISLKWVTQTFVDELHLVCPTSSMVAVYPYLHSSHL